MKFYYTTSAGVDEIQQDITNSLGGYKSITPVPNGKLRSLFGDITELTYSKGSDTCIGLMLKNETGGAITGVKVYFDYPINCYSTLMVAAVVPSTDDEGDKYIERLDSSSSLPFSATFYEADGETNAVSLPDMAIDAQLGIWIKRTVSKAAAITEYNASITKSGDVYIQADLSIEDDIDIVVEWD